MKKYSLHFIVMAVFAVMLSIGFAAQGQTATANIVETTVFNDDAGRFLTSVLGEVENNYTTALIVETKDHITFIMNLVNDSSYISTYKIVGRKLNSQIMDAKRVGDNSKIRIVRDMDSLKIDCNYNVVTNSYEAAILFNDLKFIN